MSLAEAHIGKQEATGFKVCLQRPETCCAQNTEERHLGGHNDAPRCTHTMRCTATGSQDWDFNLRSLLVGGSFPYLCNPSASEQTPESRGPVTQLERQGPCVLLHLVLGIHWMLEPNPFTSHKTQILPL